MMKFSLLSLLFFATAVFAHIPGFLTGVDFDNTSFFIDDIQLSQIYYYEFERPEGITFSFVGDVGENLYIMFGVPVGVPVMEETKGFRPRVSIYKPDGSLLKEFVLDDVEPEVMYEFFGDTNSYLYIRYDTFIQEAGTYKVVIEASEEGRAWIAFGREERFTFGQILSIPFWIRQMRDFHYLSGLAGWEKYALTGVALLAAGIVTLVLVFR